MHELVGLIDVAVEHFETQPFRTGFLQQAADLVAGFLDVGPETSKLLEFLLRRGERGAGEDDPAHDVNVGDLRQCRPAVFLYLSSQTVPRS